MSTAHLSYPGVQSSLDAAPIVAVVRTSENAEAARQARVFMDSGLELIEITFTVPEAADLVRRLREEREGGGPPWIGMGTVTSPQRAREALAAGSEFIVTPNADPEVAALVRKEGVYLVVGALTCTEIVAARNMGADLVKVYPLPPVGGPGYLEVIRGPLGDVPMLAAGGYGVDEIPAYRRAGACAFGIGAPLLRGDAAASRQHIRRALRLARGEETE